MAQPLIAGLPPDLALPAGYKIRVTALNPTSGATITGVRVTNVSLFVRNIGPSAGSGGEELASGLFKLVSGP